MCHSVLLQPTVALSHSTFGPTDPYVFLSLLYSVFRNGDERFRGARVLLPRRIMASWEHVLELVTEKAELYTPAKRQVTQGARRDGKVTLYCCYTCIKPCSSFPPSLSISSLFLSCLPPPPFPPSFLHHSLPPSLHLLRLCTLDGRMMHAVSELQDGGKYVAMEGTRPFKKVAYCATETTQTSPLHKKSLRCVTMNSHPRDMCARHIWALSIFFLLV